MHIKFLVNRTFIQSKGGEDALIKAVSALAPLATLTHTPEGRMFEYDGGRPQFLRYGKELVAFLSSLRLRPVEYSDSHPAFKYAFWNESLTDYFKRAGTLSQLIDMQEKGELFRFIDNYGDLRDFKCIRESIACIDDILKGKSKAALMAAYTREERDRAQRIITSLSLDKDFVK